MKKILLFLSAFFLLSACSPVNYSFSNPNNAAGPDFTKGRFLMNTIDVPADVHSVIEQEMLKDFKGKLGDRFAYYPQTSKILLAQKIGSSLSPSEIWKIKTGSGFDYFITLKGSVEKSGLGVVSGGEVSKQSMVRRYPENLSHIEIEIYDLNEERLIYSQKVSARTSREVSKDNRGVSFSQSSSWLVVSAYRKMFSLLEKNSVF